MAVFYQDSMGGLNLRWLKFWMAPRRVLSLLVLQKKIQGYELHILELSGTIQYKQGSQYSNNAGPM